jgi:hypothetical protein
MRLAKSRILLENRHSLAVSFFAPRDGGHAANAEAICGWAY